MNHHFVRLYDCKTVADLLYISPFKNLFWYNIYIILYGLIIICIHNFSGSSLCALVWWRSLGWCRMQQCIFSALWNGPVGNQNDIVTILTFKVRNMSSDPWIYSNKKPYGIVKFIHMFTCLYLPYPYVDVLNNMKKHI